MEYDSLEKYHEKSFANRQFKVLEFKIVIFSKMEKMHSQFYKQN
jgi:hypothetical protein